MPFFRWSSSLPASCWASVKVLLLVVHSPPGLLVNCPLSLPLFPVSHPPYCCLRWRVFPAAICGSSEFTVACETDFRCPLTSPSGASGNRLLLLRASVSQFSSLMVGLFIYVLSAWCPQWWGYNSYTWLFCEVIHYTSNINYDMRIQQWEYLYIL